MSVNNTMYALVGVKLPYDYFTEEERDGFYDTKYCDNAHKREVSSVNGLTVFIDGMSSEYVIVGKVLAKARIHDGDDLALIDMTELEPEKAEVAGKLATDFKMPVADVRLLVFTHYT